MAKATRLTGNEKGDVVGVLQSQKMAAIWHNQQAASRKWMSFNTSRRQLLADHGAGKSVDGADRDCETSRQTPLESVDKLL